jgi:hypothetical protein
MEHRMTQQDIAETVAAASRTSAGLIPIPFSRALGCVIGLLVISSLGCSAKAPASSAPPSVKETLADAPEWVTRGCRAHWQEPEERRRVVCGVGSASNHRNRVAARETAIARARTSIARSLKVTIESLVRLEEQETGEDQLDTIVHQLSSTSLRGVQLESVWNAESGEVHALVSLDLERVQSSVRDSRGLTPLAREDLARRAADAFAELDATFENESDSGASE